MSDNNLDKLIYDWWLGVDGVLTINNQNALKKIIDDEVKKAYDKGYIDCGLDK